MIKSTLSLLMLTAFIVSTSVFAQDTSKTSKKASKIVTHKTTVNKKVKKSKPAM